MPLLGANATCSVYAAASAVEEKPRRSKIHTPALPHLTLDELHGADRAKEEDSGDLSVKSLHPAMPLWE